VVKLQSIEEFLKWVLRDKIKKDHNT